jgi:hypothetical protein
VFSKRSSNANWVIFGRSMAPCFEGFGSAP